MARKLMLALVLSIIIIPLVGCTGSSQSHRPDPDTLYIGSVQTSFPAAYMPWLSREGMATTLAGLLYDSLFSYDADADVYLPAIGMEWYYVDENGEPIVTDEGLIDYARLEEAYGGPEHKYLAIKVIIHDGMTWSDGQPLTVEDVYYSFDIATNNALSNHAGALAWTSDLRHNYTNGVLTQQGLFTYDRGAQKQGYQIAEEDRDTVIYLHVNKVLGSLAPLFTSVLILPAHVWEPVVSLENQLNSTSPNEDIHYRYANPVGSGAWLLDVAESGSQQIVLHRREDYHLTKEDGSPLTQVETIKFVLYKEINVAIYALLKGHIDVLSTTVSSNYLRLFENEEDIFVSNAPGEFVQTLVFNLNPVSSERNPIRDLLGNPDFRKAMALAVNQTQLVEKVLDGAGRSESAGLMKASLVDFYNPAADSLPIDVAQRLAEANAILDQIVPAKDSAGYRLLDGKRVSFEILGSPGEQDLISYLQIQFQKIGIEVKYAAKGSQPESTYLYTSRFDLVLHGVTFSLSNIDIMYPAHFQTLGRTSNYGRLMNKELNEAIHEMRFTLDLNTKYSLIKEIQPMIAEEYYKVPLYTSNVISVARTDRFEGYQVVDGSTVFNSASLENLRKTKTGR